VALGAFRAADFGVPRRVDGGFGLPPAASSGGERVDLMDRKNEAIWALGFGFFYR